MAPTQIVILVAASIAAGAINAVAGGGTLITFPSLLLTGSSSRIANATSTLALMLGTAGSVYGYREHFAAIKTWLWQFVPVSIVGGLIGSWVLTRTSNQTFSKLVPFLILFATILFLAQGLFRRVAGLNDHPRHTASRHTIAGAIAFQFVVALYGGYFGAGIGILMLASLGFIGLQNIHEMNTLKTILSSLINLVASIWFIIAGLIDWPKALLMTAGALLGYYLGSHFSQRIPQQRVRQIITAIGLILSAVTFYKEFMH